MAAIHCISKKSAALTNSKSLARHGQGFTIVELLIVVVVIAILAAITIVAYNGIQQQAKTSALASAMSQLHKKIQTDLLQKGGGTISIAQPLAYATEIATDYPLAAPLVNAQAITLYVVFDTKNSTLSSWQHIAKLSENIQATNKFHIRTNGAGDNGIAMSYSTSVATDRSQYVSGVRNTTGPHVCWLSATTGKIDAGCDQSGGTSSALAAHTGWNFTSLDMPALTDLTQKSAIVFPEYQDVATRAQMLSWLQQ